MPLSTARQPFREHAYLRLSLEQSRRTRIHPRHVLCLLGSAALSSALLGCASSPLAHRTTAFAAAALAAISNTQDAYQLVEQTYRDAEVARLVANYDTSGFDSAGLKPFLPDKDREVRTDLLEGLEAYAELLADVSSDKPLSDVDTGAKALGSSLQSLSANDLVSARLTSTDVNLAAAAVDALGRTLVDRRRRRELPAILDRMQQPIDTICTLLEQDIGDPERSGLRNQLHNSYLNLLREQKNYIADNGAKLSPSERRAEIELLPHLATAQFEADHALAYTQKSLVLLARAHAALAVSARQKDAPAFHLRLQELAGTVQQLKSFYGSLSSKT